MKNEKLFEKVNKYSIFSDLSIYLEGVDREKEKNKCRIR